MKNYIIILKEYLNDYVIGKPKKTQITMIIYDKMMFFANNKYKKYGLLRVKEF